MAFSKYVKNTSISEVDYFPTSMPSIDVALGGGVAIGRLFEVVGAEGIGKTSLLLKIASSRIVNTENTYLLYLDAEQSLSFERIRQVWIDDENLEIDENRGILEYKGKERGILIPVETYEQTLKTLKEFIKFCTEEKYEGVVVWDSMVALVTEQILKDLGEAKAYRSRWIQDILMYIKPFMYKVHISLLAVNQIRSKMDFSFSGKSEGVMSGIDYEIAGGKPHKFLSFQTLFLQRQGQYAEYTKTNPTLFGMKVKVNPIKNKLYTPNKIIGENVLIYEIGYNSILSILEFFRSIKLLSGKGLGSIKIKGLLEDKGLDLKDFCKTIIDNSEFRMSFLMYAYSMYARELNATSRLQSLQDKINEASELLRYDAIKLLRHIENNARSMEIFENDFEEGD